ncbi:DUF6478 family protein [Pseudoroseicyclus sp. CXY001]|uniref:DUF6478 family protein n=1 Tax=Pseudoroseicyclus sp. CXY001 TaxID=3242492 RepID=UPI003571321F
MAGTGMSRVERALTERSTARWARWAKKAPRAGLTRLAAQAEAAQALRHELGEVIAAADRRLGVARHGQPQIARPPGCDWAWRPALWQSALTTPALAGAGSRSALGPEVTLFHDCPRREIILRQVRNGAAGQTPPFGLEVEVFAFEGSFLSLVLELPAEAAAGLGRRHVVRLNLTAEMERPLELFARLNLRHGPNTEQIVREVPAGGAEVAFDLGYATLDEKRIERLWLDLIFESPRMTRVTLRDVTLLRHPRAEL